MFRRSHHHEDIDPYTASTPHDWSEEPLRGDYKEQNDTPEADETFADGASDPQADTTDGEPQPTSPKRVRNRLRLGQFLTGGVLSRDEFTNRLPVVVYIFLLMLIYIWNGFRIQQKHNRLDQLASEIKTLNTIAVTTSAVRMSGTRQSEIERLLQKYNIQLIISPTPPTIIERPKTKDQAAIK